MENRSIVRGAQRGVLIVLMLTHFMGLIALVTLFIFVNHAERDRELLWAAKVAASVEIDRPLLFDDGWSVQRFGPGLSNGIDSAWVDQTVSGDTPTFWNMGSERVVLLPIQSGSFDSSGHGEGLRDLLVATAPRAALTSGMVRAGLVYLLAVGGASLVALWVHQQLLGQLFSPLIQATRLIRGIRLKTLGTPIPEDGPKEVRSLIHAFNGILGRLERAASAQSRFTSEAAHELRTPVTIMQGELDVALRRERSADEYREVLTSVREETFRLGEIVEGLLAMARVEAGQVDQERTWVKMSEIAAEAARQESFVLSNNNCPLKVEIIDDAELFVHRGLIQMALTNLLRNAANYAPNKPVWLSLGVHGKVAAFVVEDGGPGVSIEDRERFFERFGRGSLARRDIRTGLGLGLPLAREIARRHGGTVAFDDPTGGGCRVVLSLKIHERPVKKTA